MIAESVSTGASAQVGAGIARAEEARIAGASAVTRAVQAAAAQSSDGGSSQPSEKKPPF